MKINYNELARFLLDIKIEIPLFDHFNRLTKEDWNYYRGLITDNWLNVKNELDGISIETIRRKIDYCSRKLNDATLSKQDIQRNTNKFKSGTRLKQGNYDFNDLKKYLNFNDPVEILISIIKKDIKRGILIKSITDTKNAIAYLNSKRVEQYHPESSNIYRQEPYNEHDIRQILIHGRSLFLNLGNQALSSSFDYYLSDIGELIQEWNGSITEHDIGKVFSNLPKRNHTEWGFEGYEKERAELIDKISKGNRRLFQVVGQGGSGKSALVNEVCHDIYLKHNDNLGYDQFIWISSKSDILENATIKTINNPTQYGNYKDLLIQLFLAINSDEISDFKEFADFDISELEKFVGRSLNGDDKIKRLIVIDNLENISKENQKKILSFLEDNIDKPNNAIITSRFRIIEDFPAINIELGGLSEEHAVNLFNKFIDYYQIDFKIQSKEDSNLVKEFVKIANYYPLAIKYCVEKSKIETISLKSSFETCKFGGSDLHSFIFRDTYGQLDQGQKRLLKTIVVYKTNYHQNIDKQVLRVIFNTVYKSNDFDSSINALYEKTLISYIGLSNDDVEVILTDLIASHVEDILNRHNIDISKITKAINSFITNQNEINEAEEIGQNLRTSEIQNKIFLNVLQNASNQIDIDRAIFEISRFSSTFYGLGYLEAKSLEYGIRSNKEAIRKKVNDAYLKSIRLNPDFPLFWIDYIRFLKKYYPLSIKAKLLQNLGQILSQFFHSNIKPNRDKFAELCLEFFSITKSKNEKTILFMENVIQKKVELNYDKSHLQTIKYVIQDWLKKPSKHNYLRNLIENDNLKTIIVKLEYPLFEKINKAINP